MKIFNKIKLSSKEVENSIFIDSHWFSLTDHVEKTEESELVDKIKSMPFLDRKDMAFTYNEISHFFDHDYVNIRKFLYSMTLLKNSSGHQLYKFDNRNGISGVRLIGDIKSFLNDFGKNDMKLEDVDSSKNVLEETQSVIESVDDSKDIQEETQTTSEQNVLEETQSVDDSKKTKSSAQFITLKVCSLTKVKTPRAGASSNSPILLNTLTAAAR
jgi:hypothetical protein